MWGVKPQKIGSGRNRWTLFEYKNGDQVYWGGFVIEKEWMRTELENKWKMEEWRMKGGTENVMVKWNWWGSEKKRIEFKKEKKKYDWVDRYDGSKEDSQGSKGTESVLFESIFISE